MERRLYPRDGFAAHLIGYVGEVSEDDAEPDPRYAAYEPGDVVGKAGVEETYDQILRGAGRLPRRDRRQPRTRGGLPAASSTRFPDRTCA